MYLLNSRSNRMPLYKYWQLVILPNLSNLLLEGGGGEQGQILNTH